MTEISFLYRNTIPVSLKKLVEKIYYARKSLPFWNEKPWMKRETNLFDITMETYDDAEVSELVGIFMLHKISENTVKTT